MRECPSSNICPELGARNPVAMLINVDLPVPFPPLNPTRSPGFKTIEMSSSTWTPPNDLVMRLSSNIAAPNASPQSVDGAGAQQALGEYNQEHRHQTAKGNHSIFRKRSDALQQPDINSDTN